MNNQPERPKREEMAQPLFDFGVAHGLIQAPDKIRPRDVPGFHDAFNAGILPQVATHPPAVLPGQTVGQMGLRFLIGLGGVFVGAAIPIMTNKAGWLIPAVTLLGVAAGIFASKVIRAKATLELKHGYTTSRETASWFFNLGKNRHMRWNFAGAWQLNRNGTVVSVPPDPLVEPPGYYPSPHKPESLGLWSGYAWANRYQDYPTKPS
jgi:hypothetical protein